MDLLDYLASFSKKRSSGRMPGGFVFAFIALEVLRRASGPLLAMLAVGLFLRFLLTEVGASEVLRAALRTPLDDVSWWLRLCKIVCTHEGSQTTTTPKFGRRNFMLAHLDYDRYPIPLPLKETFA
jgi:hypothetical protein